MIIDKDLFLLNERPVFVVGYPRSGTTLIQSLISTQKNIVSFPETHFFNYCAKEFLPHLQLYPDEVNTIVQRVEDKMGFNVCPEKLDFLLRVADRGEIYKKNVFDFVIRQSILNFSRDKIVSGRELTWVEKTPGHAKYLNEIFSLYPQAKVIVMIREPSKAIISRKLKIPSDSHKSIKGLAKSWSRLYENVYHIKNQKKDNLIIVRLEDLLSDKRGSLLGLFHFLCLDCNEKRFESFGAEAKRLITNNEPWKSDVQKGRFIENTDYGINFIEKLILKKTTSKISSLYGY